MLLVQAITISVLFSVGTFASEPSDCDSEKDGAEKPCDVALPQKATLKCGEKRTNVLQAKKQLYKIGSVPGVPFAVLEMDPMKLFGLNIKDPFTSTFMKLSIMKIRTTEHLIQEYIKTHTKEFTTYKDYEDTYRYFASKYKAPNMIGKYFRYASDVLPVKDIVTNQTWMEDRVFADRRLAGLNPMCLARITGDGESNGVKWSSLKNRLKSDINWERLFQSALDSDDSLSEIIKDGSAFVCHYPLFDNIKRGDDLMGGSGPTRHMWSPMSPIALFASKFGSNGKREMVPVAIQMDIKSDSKVADPTSGDMWTLAKEGFAVTDFVYVELIEHLLKTHIVMEPICVGLERHLSTLHPLYQILRWHCRGVNPTNKLAFKVLLGKDGAISTVHPTGFKGSVQLLFRAYSQRTWKDTDIRANIKKRGMDDKAKVPYFPYRDDGELLYSEIKNFAKKYIFNYYNSDDDVKQDREVQAFANELSSDGKGNNGGKGKLRDFPASVSTRCVLADILSRVIFTSSVQHAAVNFPITEYGGYTPALPTKMYDDNRVPDDVFDLPRLPNGKIAAFQGALAASLGSFHLDDLLDYGANLVDKKGGAIVLKAYKRLKEVIKPIMDERNRKRLEEGHLSYPYLTPEWVPNSIST